MPKVCAFNHGCAAIKTLSVLLFLSKSKSLQSSMTEFGLKGAIIWGKGVIFVLLYFQIFVNVCGKKGGKK